MVPVDRTNPEESAPKGMGKTEPEAGTGAGDVEPRPEGPLTVKASSATRTVTCRTKGCLVAASSS